MEWSGVEWSGVDSTTFLDKPCYISIRLTVLSLSISVFITHRHISFLPEA